MTRHRGIHIHRDRDPVRLQPLPGAQEFFWIFPGRFQVRRQIANQILQRKSRNLVKSLPVGDLQRAASNLRTETIGKPVVVIVSRVVVPRGSEVEQTPQVAGNPGKRALQEILVGLLDRQRLDHCAHAFVIPASTDNEQS